MLTEVPTDRKRPTRLAAATLSVAAGATGALFLTADPATAADDPGCTKNDGQIVEQVPIASDTGPTAGYDLGVLALWYSPSTECVWATAATHPGITDHGPIQAKVFKENNGARVGWNNSVWPHKAATDAWYVGRDTEFSAYGRIDSGMHYVDAWTDTYVIEG